MPNGRSVEDLTAVLQREVEHLGDTNSAKREVKR